MHLKYPETIPPTPSPWKDCLPQSLSLVPKRLGTIVLRQRNAISAQVIEGLDTFVSRGWKGL